MRHRRIPKSSKNKKFKNVKSCDSDDEDEAPASLTERKRQRLLSKVQRLKTQSVPRRMREIMDFNDPVKRKEMAAREKESKKMRKEKTSRIDRTSDGDDTAGATRGLKPVPDFVEKGPYESEEQFLSRISRMTADARAEAALEHRFGLDLCPAIQPQVLSTKSGASVNRKPKKKKLKNGMTETERLEAKRQKRRDRDSRRRGKKKKRNAGQVDEFDVYQDDIRFGDVVSAPPLFSKRRPQL